MSAPARGTEWDNGLAAYGRRLRNGSATATQVTEAALDRIAAADDKFRAFVQVDAERAKHAARGIDSLLAAGVDLGPLMGVPVAVKDLFAVTGMPTQAGSRLDLSHAIGPEGPLIGRLKRAGAIILGKARMVEFAAGAQNIGHPTPWNPADPDRHRSPGGSSNGSAVAVAAGFCPIAIGSDTGGSVRAPAALCGIVGSKASAQSFSLDGAFPLCPAMDSVGFFALSAEDAAIAHGSLADARPPRSAPDSLTGMRFGVPHDAALSDLDAEVAEVFEASLRKLERAGGHLVPLDWPDPAEIEQIGAIYAGLVPSDLIATLGVERIETNRDSIDPVALDRLDRASAVPAHAYAELSRIRHAFARRAAERMTSLDAVIQPTSPICAPLVDDLGDVASASAFTKRALGLTRMANVYGFTACSIPMREPGSGLPIGLDISGPSGSDLLTLDLARRVQNILKS